MPTASKEGPRVFVILRSSQATNGEEMVSDRFDGKVWLPDPT